VGQAFRLGRYPLHFHMVGSVSRSYIHSVAIHRTFNRAFTIHGVKNLKISDSVAYDVKGHAVFVEDGGETDNTVDGVLVT